jgi:hypothetical protein
MGLTSSYGLLRLSDRVDEKTGDLICGKVNLQGLLESLAEMIESPLQNKNAARPGFQVIVQSHAPSGCSFSDHLKLQQQLLNWFAECLPEGARRRTTIIADRKFHSIHLATWIERT